MSSSLPSRGIRVLVTAVAAGWVVRGCRRCRALGAARASRRFRDPGRGARRARRCRVHPTREHHRRAGGRILAVRAPPSAVAA